MKYNGVIVRKIEIIEERLLKLEMLTPLTTQTLARDFFLKSGIERTLQVCIEAVIDIAERIISLEGLSPATCSFNSLKRLEDLDILKDAEKYKGMIQFRNFIVHRYESIDAQELVNVCNNHLQDFREFIVEIKRHE